MKYDLSQMINAIGSGPGPKSKVKESEKVIIKNMLGKKFSIDNKDASEVINTVASKTGLNPAFLAANAFQEGMNLAINDDNAEKSGAYWEQNVEEDSYPVDGFLYYGLDRFGEMADKLKKKGYISDEFDYREYQSMNEKKQPIRTAAFKNNEDALMAKAAMIRDIKDSVDEYATKKGMKLEPKSVDYFVMSAYNGGMGNTRIMMDEMSKSKASQSEFIDKGLTSRKGVHKNIVPRIEKMGMINELMVGPVAPIKKPVPSFNEVMRMFNPEYGKK
jgi:replicative superfamily II helicase